MNEVERLEERIELLIIQAKATTNEEERTKLMKPLNNLAAEYKQLTGRPYTSESVEMAGYVK